MSSRSRRHRPRVVVADTAYSRTQPVREVLENDGFVVVSQPPPISVLAAVAEHRPDVVILDDDFVDDRPPRTIANIRALAPQTRVVVFASRDDIPAELGADGYVGKSVPPDGALTRLLSGLVGRPEKGLKPNPARTKPMPKSGPRPRRHPRQPSRPAAGRSKGRRIAVTGIVVLAISLLVWGAVSANDGPEQGSPAPPVGGQVDVAPAGPATAPISGLERGYEEFLDAGSPPGSATTDSPDATDTQGATGVSGVTP